MPILPFFDGIFVFYLFHQWTMEKIIIIYWITVFDWNFIDPWLNINFPYNTALWKSVDEWKHYNRDINDHSSNINHSLKLSKSFFQCILFLFYIFQSELDQFKTWTWNQVGRTYNQYLTIQCKKSNMQIQTSKITRGFHYR